MLLLPWIHCVTRVLVPLNMALPHNLTPDSGCYCFLAFCCLQHYDHYGSWWRRSKQLCLLLERCFRGRCRLMCQFCLMSWHSAVVCHRFMCSKTGSRLFRWQLSCFVVPHILKTVSDLCFTFCDACFVLSSSKRNIHFFVFFSPDVLLLFLSLLQ